MTTPAPSDDGVMAWVVPALGLFASSLIGWTGAVFMTGRRVASFEKDMRNADRRIDALEGRVNELHKLQSEVRETLASLPGAVKEAIDSGPLRRIEDSLRDLRRRVDEISDRRDRADDQAAARRREAG